METPIVDIIQLESPITAVGKTFVGDYSASPKYAMEVQKLLTEASIVFIPNKVIGVYYDNPENTPPENLTCFQGFVVPDENVFTRRELSKIALRGRFLHTKVSGDPAKIIYDGYNALFSHIQEKGIALKSNTGYQISTFENNMITIEIYMEIL
jgi:DNA gyrase inhibitor GyrI